MAPILQIDGLTRRFGGVTAVDALVARASTKASWSASSGRTAPARPRYSISSPGSTRPTPARVTFDGRDITGLAAEQLAPLGFARTFQHGRVFGNLSVLDNVLVGAHTRLAAVRPQWPV